MLTLLIDGNWLLMSRFFTMSDWFLKTNSKEEKEKGQNIFIEQMLKSINIICNTFPTIDNIIYVADGGSWRKKLNKPESVPEIYKDNRKKDENIDWEIVFKTQNMLIDILNKNNISAFKHIDIEGDDWIAGISKRLNNDNINCLIWSTDCDLKQLVSNTSKAFTAWYNDKSGLCFDFSLEKDEEDFIMSAINTHKETVINDLKSKCSNIEYINPQDIIINKIIAGDKSDNIKSIALYKSGSKTYSFTEKKFSKIKESLDINTVEDLFDNKEEVAKIIHNTKNYDNCSENSIIEHLDYNRLLVELNNVNMPNDLKKVINNAEIKFYDVDYFRNNYEVLLGKIVDKNVEELLNDIPF